MAVTQNGLPVAAVDVTAGGVVSTAAWTPVTGHVYLIIVGYQTNQSGVAQSASLAWSTGGANCTAPVLEKTENLSQFHVTLETWLTACTGTPGSSVITATGNAFATAAAIVIVDLTGANTTTPLGSPAQGATSGLIIAVTPATTGGLILEAGFDDNTPTTATAATGCTLIEFLTFSGDRLWVTCATTNTVAGTPQTVGVTSTATTSQAQIGIEIAPAAATNPMPQPRLVTRQALVRASSY